MSTSRYDVTCDAPDATFTNSMPQYFQHKLRLSPSKTYIIRFWLEVSVQDGTDIVWRCRLEDPKEGVAVSFENFMAFQEFIESELDRLTPF